MFKKFAGMKFYFLFTRKNMDRNVIEPHYIYCSITYSKFENQGNTTDNYSLI